MTAATPVASQLAQKNSLLLKLNKTLAVSLTEGDAKIKKQVDSNLNQ